MRHNFRGIRRLSKEHGGYLDISPLEYLQAAAVAAAGDAFDFCPVCYVETGHKADLEIFVFQDPHYIAPPHSTGNAKAISWSVLWCTLCRTIYQGPL